MLKPGYTIMGRYRIDARVGFGGMGAVYKATDLRLGKVWAIKVLTADSLATPMMFEREARILATLDHPSLPGIIDHGSEHNGHFQFLVMEYIEGDDLDALLERHRRPFSVQTTLDWADQLLDVLDYIHNHQPAIIHRDIKPKNIKIRPNGEAVLIDFGIAKAIRRVRGKNAMMQSIAAGTLNFAPLEQLEGSAPTDARSDIYALGATLYNVLTNTVPVDAVTRRKALLAGRKDPLQPVSRLNPTVPAGLDAILQRAMDLRMNHRFQSAQEMRHALLALRTRLHEAVTQPGDQPARRAAPQPPPPSYDQLFPLPEPDAPRPPKPGRPRPNPLPEARQPARAPRRRSGRGNTDWRKLLQPITEHSTVALQMRDPVKIGSAAALLLVLIQLLSRLHAVELQLEPARLLLHVVMLAIPAAALWVDARGLITIVAATASPAMLFSDALFQSLQPKQGTHPAVSHYAYAFAAFVLGAASFYVLKDRVRTRKAGLRQPPLLDVTTGRPKLAAAVSALALLLGSLATPVSQSGDDPAGARALFFGSLALMYLATLLFWGKISKLAGVALSAMLFGATWSIGLLEGGGTLLPLPLLLSVVATAVMLGTAVLLLGEQAEPAR